MAEWVRVPTLEEEREGHQISLPVECSAGAEAVLEAVDWRFDFLSQGHWPVVGWLLVFRARELAVRGFPRSEEVACQMDQVHLSPEVGEEVASQV